MTRQAILKSELLAVAGLIAVALIAGRWLGQPVAWLCAALSLYLAWVLINLWRLSRWLDLGAGKPPVFSGLPGAIASEFRSVLEASAKGKRKRSGYQKRLRQAISALPHAALIIDRNDRIQWSNPAARPMLGLEWPQDRGQAIKQLIPKPELHAYMAAGQFAQPIEFDSPGHHGHHGHRLSLLVTRFGRKRQRLVLATDITRLHNLDRVRRDFVANVSHELRTPLTVIGGFLETMEEDSERYPEWQRSIELMEQQTRRMKALINDLLALSKLEMDSIDAQEPVPVPALLQTVVDEAASVSALNGHHISLDADPGLWLLGSPEPLRSVFSNLVVNAVQHTPPGTEVRVSWQRDGDDAVFSVCDDGDGIPPNHLPRLTERFYRVDKARSRRKGGTGLGLAIVKHALARHGSSLEVSSREGQGACFECRFAPRWIAVAEGR
jgi:two-component system phosphate regulon sensor histidine kinase PhoR